MHRFDICECGDHRKFVDETPENRAAILSVEAISGTAAVLTTQSPGERG